MIERSQPPYHALIVEQPDLNAGYPTVATTRIAVGLIVDAWHETGDLHATIEAFPQLSQEQVQAALDYAQAHPERIAADRERNAKALHIIRSR